MSGDDTNAGRMNGLDLFSGIGGLTLALSPWVRPVAYCEIDRYAQSVLLSRMSERSLPWAPIWDDIKTLHASHISTPEIGIDIIYGGFPCQDISVAGNGKGLAGERSGLFFEIMRLAEEIKPRFIFLENVPAIRTRGLEHVAEWLACAGYDCRWDFVSAQEVGAPHLRNRWFCLAHANSERRKTDKKSNCKSKSWGQVPRGHDINGLDNPLSDTKVSGLEGQWQKSGRVGSQFDNFGDGSWWSTEPNVGRVANGVPQRVDRIKGLGNAVVPAQAREAFKRLAGLT